MILGSNVEGLGNLGIGSFILVGESQSLLCTCMNDDIRRMLYIFIGLTVRNSTLGDD